MRHLLALLALLFLAAFAAACESPGSGSGDPCACVVPNSGVLLACGTESCIDGNGWACTQGVIAAAPSACEPPADCKPICNDAVCGTDGCGGSCGTCAAGKVCGGGFCVPEGGPCVPTCNSAACGADGCGGACGTCAAGSSCDGGACKTDTICKPVCNDAVCGPDGCGGVCGTCSADQICTLAGFCTLKDDNCTPQCGGAECGSDGCLGVCGTCGAAEKCEAGQCVDDSPVCTPVCGGKVCGPDGCGGLCGSCKSSELCAAGKCEPEDVGCAPGLFECDGACVDYLSDPLHCGSCAGKCPTQQGALAICIQAECYLSCEDQKNTPANVNFNNDINNCGVCAKVCPTMPGGVAKCSQGQCLDPCEVVNGDACGGKCVDLYNDDDNCGKCGEVCAADAECNGGTCYCGSFQQHCSGQCVDDDDINHCEACDTPCPEVENGEVTCWSGKCDFWCDDNYTQCGDSGGCVGGGGAPCGSDEDCCGAEGYVCYQGQCTGYPKCSSASGCPDPPNYECAFDVCLRKCSSSSQCADESGLSGNCYESHYSPAHGFWVGTDACWLSCSVSADCPYAGMTCATTNWSGDSGKMCVWN